MQRLGVLTLPTVEKNLHIIDSWLSETPIFWPPNAKSWLIWKDPEVGEDWRQEEKGTTEDERARWHHWLNGHEFGCTLGVGDGQGGLAYCSQWGHKEWTWMSDWTEQKTPNSQSSLKKDKTGRIMLPDLKLYYHARVINTVWYWHINRYIHRLTEQESQAMNSYLCGQLV